MNRIKEIFAPTTIQTVEDLIAYLIQEVEGAGGDPNTIRMLHTPTTIPNVEFSDEWPCWTIDFDLRPDQPAPANTPAVRTLGET